MIFTLRHLNKDDLLRLRQFWKENWGDEFVVAHGVIYHPDCLSGFIAVNGTKWLGAVTYTFSGNDCQIVSIDSLYERQGIGTALIETVVKEARAKKCRRVFLSTTNDNLNALDFYQKRDFELVKIYRGAVNESRKLKPSIPMIGNDGIPLRDEIELEMPL